MEALPLLLGLETKRGEGLFSNDPGLGFFFRGPICQCPPEKRKTWLRDSSAFQGKPQTGSDPGREMGPTRVSGFGLKHKNGSRNLFFAFCECFFDSAFLRSPPRDRARRGLSESLPLVPQQSKLRSGDHFEGKRVRFFN